MLGPPNSFFFFLFCVGGGWDCWWLKSCTSWCGRYPIIYKVFYVQVVQDFFHQQEGCEFCRCFHASSCQAWNCRVPPCRVFCDERCATTKHHKVFFPRFQDKLFYLLPKLGRISPKNKKLNVRHPPELLNTSNGLLLFGLQLPMLAPGENLPMTEVDSFFGSRGEGASVYPSRMPVIVCHYLDALNLWIIYLHEWLEL